MSYINQNNIYGIKPNNDNSSDYGMNAKRYQPIQANEDLYQNAEISVSCCNDREDTCPNRIVQPSCGCAQPPTPPCGCGQPTPPPPCGCVPPTPPTPPCNCTCNCSCNTPTPSDLCDECTPVTNCCSGETCVFDPCKSKCICTYMDVLYDEETAGGPTLFNAFSASIPAYNLTSEFFQTPGCCNGCAVDSTSTFVVDSVNVTLKSFVYTGATIATDAVVTTTISPSSILVNGLPVLSVTQTPNGYSASVDPLVLNTTCNCQDKGTNSNVLIQSLSGFSYTAKYVFCGKVTTNGTTCKFKIIAQNNTIPDLITSSLSFVAPSICMPEINPPEILNLNMQFGATGQIVNPVITAIGGPSPTPVTLTVSGNLMLNTKADLQVSKNTKVCIQGMIP